MKDKIIIHVNPDILDLVPGYISHRKNDLPVIREHLVNNRFEEIRVIGHKMKGGGKLYNLELVTILGDKIENASIETNKPLIEKAVAELEDYLERVEVVCNG